MQYRLPHAFSGRHPYLCIVLAEADIIIRVSITAYYMQLQRTYGYHKIDKTRSMKVPGKFTPSPGSNVVIVFRAKTVAFRWLISPFTLFLHPAAFPSFLQTIRSRYPQMPSGTGVVDAFKSKSL